MKYCAYLIFKRDRRLVLSVSFGWQVIIVNYFHLIKSYFRIELKPEWTMPCCLYRVLANAIFFLCCSRLFKKKKKIQHCIKANFYIATCHTIIARYFAQECCIEIARKPVAYDETRLKMLFLKSTLATIVINPCHAFV